MGYKITVVSENITFTVPEGTNLLEALRTVGAAPDAPCGGNGKCRSLRALFQASFPYLDRESRRLLSSLLREIGSSYREEQLKRCDFYLDALRMRREKIFEELPSRLKTGVAISICTALGVTVLLW